MKERDLKYSGEKGIPIDWKPGNSVEKNTGLWRTEKPVIDLDVCSGCRICFVYCPDSAIKMIDRKPVIQYSICKGCFICAEECPRHAIMKGV